MINIGYADAQDFDWLSRDDGHVDAKWIRRCIAHNEYIVAIDGEQPLGFLRFSLFWGKVPYMDMILVKESHRRQGVGSGLFDFWEREMRKANARVLMTSSVIHETAPQVWHQRNGFEACGQITFGQYDPTAEVFFVKNL